MTIALDKLGPVPTFRMFSIAALVSVTATPATFRFFVTSAVTFTASLLASAVVSMTSEASVKAACLAGIKVIFSYRLDKPMVMVEV